MPESFYGQTDKVGHGYFLRTGPPKAKHMEGGKVFKGEFSPPLPIEQARLKMLELVPDGHVIFSDKLYVDAGYNRYVGVR